MDGSRVGERRERGGEREGGERREGERREGERRDRERERQREGEVGESRGSE